MLSVCVYVALVLSFSFELWKNNFTIKCLQFLNPIIQALEEDLASASESIGKSKISLQKLGFFREDVLDKKKTDVHANMILEIYEQNERKLNTYFDAVSKQFERTSQFYKDVDKFEAWFPKIEEKLEVEEQLDDDPNNLRKLLTEFEVSDFMTL